MVDVKQAEFAINNDDINLLPWTAWSKMPSPEQCRLISGPRGAGVYQIRNFAINKNIQFGIGTQCSQRMKSLFPKPFGTGTRNNLAKREYILEYWSALEFRTLKTIDISVAKMIEHYIKVQNSHLFNT